MLLNSGSNPLALGPLQDQECGILRTARPRQRAPAAHTKRDAAPKIDSEPLDVNDRGHQAVHHWLRLDRSKGIPETCAGKAELQADADIVDWAALICKDFAFVLVQTFLGVHRFQL